jgi:ring-1,2-phenylacetyl-CoA epoxidase subunit PaaE
MISKVTLVYEGKEHVVIVEDGETILEAGLRDGVDLPYSCMSGVCTACLAHKVSGDLNMDGAEAIDADEIAEGKVLTCCAYPRSPEVKLRYE